MTSLLVCQASTRILTQNRIGQFFTYPPWDLVSEKSVFGPRKHRLRLDGRPTEKTFSPEHLFRVDGALDWAEHRSREDRLTKQGTPQ